MQLGYVCTNYNNAQYSLAAINSLNSRACKQNIIIVIVDNGSDREDVDKLNVAKQYDNVHLIFNKDNIGYFKGLNCGIKYLKQNFSTIDFIVIGNNDLIFPSDFYESVLSNKDTLQQHAVVSPNITTLDGLNQNPHVINSISKPREMVYDLYYSNYYIAQLIIKVAKITKMFTDRKDEEQHDIAQEIYQGHGSCYILGPLFFKYFDALWAPTFLMGEEFFLSVQLMGKGMKVYYEPLIKVLHHCNGAIGNMPKKQMWNYAKEAHKLYRKHVGIFK